MAEIVWSPLMETPDERQERLAFLASVSPKEYEESALKPGTLENWLGQYDQYQHIEKNLKTEIFNLTSVGEEKKNSMKRLIRIFIGLCLGLLVVMSIRYSKHHLPSTIIALSTTLFIMQIILLIGACLTAVMAVKEYFIATFATDNERGIKKRREEILPGLLEKLKEQQQTLEEYQRVIWVKETEVEQRLMRREEEQNGETEQKDFDPLTAKLKIEEYGKRTVSSEVVKRGYITWEELYADDEEPAPNAKEAKEAGSKPNTTAS